VPLSPALAARTVTRLRATVTADPSYGDPVLDWTNADALDIAGCALEPAGTVDVVDATRSAVTIRWNLYAPPGADIGPDDRIEANGDTFEVEGRPQAWSHPSGTLDYVTVSLVRVEG
jgi:hypothetical protein